MTTITRRNLLKIGAAGTATAILAGCGQDTERWVELEPYVLAPEEQLAGNPSFYATTCRMCPAACGIVVKIMNGRAIKIEGNPAHPVSQGKTCARGQAGPQLLYNPDRVTGAVKQDERGKRDYDPIPWNEAINTVFERIDAADGAVGVWLGSTTSGHLVELFRRFAEATDAPTPVRYDLYTGFNGYTVLSQVTGTLFDQAGLPTYDLAHADAVFSFGADFLGTWLSATGYGVQFGQFRNQEYGKRGLLVQFEPRMSITGAKADRWLPVRPGAETLVAGAIARLIADEGFGSADRVERAAALAPAVDLEEAAAACHTTVEELVTLARAFGEADRPLAIPGSILTGHSSAVEAVAAVQVLNVIAGTNGLSTTPATPAADLTVPPLSTYAEAQTLIDRMANGEIKVLLVHGANPVFDLPPDSGFVEALANVETVVSFNPLVDETAVHADFILPDRVFLEGWGYEVVAPGFGGLPVISGQQPVVGPLYDSHSTGDVLLTVARGIPAAASVLPWTDEVAFIKDMITQLPKGAAGGEDNDVRWSRFQQHGGWWPESAPEESAPQATISGPVEVTPTVFQGDAEEYPYFLHLYLSPLLGDGSGANLPWLQGSPDPLTTITWGTWIELNPHTADELGVDNGDIVKLTSPHGEIEAPVYIFPAIRPDTIAVPIGQGHTDLGRYAKKRGSHPLHLIGIETDTSGSTLVWSTVRVQIEKTGDTKTLARMESTIDSGEHGHVPF
ncbi:MAG: molybdopterin-dependent oxidoreductase [Anaerolineae bacterium]|nr:molybdopterin-dependent oxidoreductase [Anaerolineae bacterium]